MIFIQWRKKRLDSMKKKTHLNLSIYFHLSVGKIYLNCLQFTLTKPLKDCFILFLVVVKNKSE